MYHRSKHRQTHVYESMNSVDKAVCSCIHDRRAYIQSQQGSIQSLKVAYRPPHLHKCTPSYQRTEYVRRNGVSTNGLSLIEADQSKMNRNAIEHESSTSSQQVACVCSPAKPYIQPLYHLDTVSTPKNSGIGPTGAPSRTGQSTPHEHCHVSHQHTIVLAIKELACARVCKQPAGQ
jgi:hypothetical protein